MSRIRVSPDQLLHISKQIDQGRQQLESMRTQLTLQIQFIQSFWAGATKEKFFHDFYLSQPILDSALGSMTKASQDLMASAEKFRQADAEQGNTSGAITGIPPLAASMAMMTTKGTGQSKAAYNFDEYEKKLVGNMWVLSKNGLTDQKAAQATLAYNEALKNGDIKIDNGSDDVDIIQEQTKAAMEGYNLWTGEKIPKWQAAFIIIGGIAYNFQGIRGSHGVKLNRNLKLPSRSFRLPKEPFKNSGKGIPETHPSKPIMPQENGAAGASNGADFYKLNGGLEKKDFMTIHSEKHLYNPDEISTKKKTQFGKDIDVIKLREDTVKNPDNIKYNDEQNTILYKKEYGFNISTPETPTGSHRVYINLNPKPNKTNRNSQFPFFKGE
ncbi:WXG100 family type VII secretion target [Paenibacillus sp. 23TSA30-6]|uniref:WXG100 family type VII secretion target n=1 Tax=Paenibacillus sp. 23TSA30-6 TaxID=2546104 RepID=UPI0017886153|nr:WXG100 family type VII secretion target [Paenibacillus sp. 23TSA30-6]MBE0336165.1 WXG100 family type VII secretion target [Paenibacillus sp. 23TSA30-6]